MADDDKQARFGRRYEHFVLKPEELPKPPKVVGEKRKRHRFPNPSKTEIGILSKQLSEIQKNAENRTKIVHSPVIHFIVELSDSICWKPIGVSIEKLGLSVVNYIDEKHIRVSLQKEIYEKFLANLEKNSRYIESIKEIALPDKVDEMLLQEIREKPDEKTLVSIEFSSTSGLADLDVFENAITEWVDKERYGTLKRTYESDTTLLLSGTLVNRGIEILAEQIETLSFVAKIPAMVLEDVENSSRRIDDDLSLELDSVIQLDHPSNITANLSSSVITIDSGVNRSHSLLSQNISDMYDYSTHSSMPCTDDVGHGSGVAGLAVYGEDLRKNPLPSASVIAVKNFDGNRREIEKDTISVILEAINRYKFRSRIVNLSFSARGPNPSLTKALDEIVFSEDCIIVASAGNIKPEHIESFLNSGENYPDYINHQIVYFPADCRNVITVGGHTESSSSFVSRNCPSPFTRSGYSSNIIKPEVMAVGGNLERTNVAGSNRVFSASGLGIITASNMGSGRSEQFGTSFSSPIVSNIASSIIQRRLGLSAFLIKAILISSCSQMLDSNSQHAFSSAIQGFGKVEKEYAINSLDWRVCYLMQGEFDSISPDVFHRYHFLFPDAADHVEVTVVVGKLKSGLTLDSDEYVRLYYKRPGVKFATPLKTGIRIGDRKDSSYKEIVHIERGSRGPWTLNVSPHFSRLPVRQRIKYGIVIVVSSSKKESIYSAVMNWIRPQMQRLLVPPIQNQ